MYVYIYIYMYMYIYTIYIYIYIYTHICVLCLYNVYTYQRCWPHPLVQIVEGHGLPLPAQLLDLPDLLAGE